jgi:hypothetical protein
MLATLENMRKREKMNIEEMKLGDVLKLMEMFGPKGQGQQEKLPFAVGDYILVRTVTMIQIGKVEEIDSAGIVLSDTGWVADTGRFHECLSNGSLEEFERAPAWCYVNRGSVVDIFPWPHKVPEQSK